MKKLKKSNGVVDVNLIPALNNNPFISRSTRDDLQDLFLKAENFYNLYQLREIKKKTNKFSQFEKCLFCIHDYKLKARLPFAKVFVKADGTVGYTIILRHLQKLNLSPQEAEILTIKRIYTPILSNHYDCWFSIYSHIDAFFYVLENEVSYNNEHGFVCTPYQIETDFERIGGKESVKQDDNKSIKEKALILPEGLVLIYR